MTRLRGAFWLAGAASVVAAILSAPVLMHPTTRLVGSEIAGRHYDPFIVITQFERPMTLGLYTQPATDFPGALLARVTGGVAAYNLIVLLSFPLAAFFAFLFAHRITGSGAAAALAAFMFAFSPFHIAHAAYHPHVAQVQWIPLYLLALWNCLDRFHVNRAALLIMATGLVTFSNFYGGLIAAVMTPVVIAAFWLTSPREVPVPASPPSAPLDSRSVLKTTATLLLVALAGMAYIFSIAPPVLFDRQAVSVARDDLARYGAAWWAYLVPAVEQPLVGAWAARVFAQHGLAPGLVEQQVTPGVSLIALALIAAGVWIVDRRNRTTVRAVPVLLVVGVAAYVCSLAPDQRIAGIVLPSPSTFFYSFAPMFRAYARFGVVVQLAVATLAGLGFAFLIARPARWPRYVGYTLALTAALESVVVPAWRGHDVLPTAGHRWIAGLPPTIRVLDLSPATDDAYLVPHFVGRDITFLNDRVGEITDHDLPKTIAGLGFTHVIYRRPSPASQWLESRPLPTGFHVLRSLPDSAVLAVDVWHPIVWAKWSRGFYEPESAGGESWRWMAGEADWLVTNGEGSPQTAGLSIELQSFARARDIDVRLNGEWLCSLAATPGRTWQRLAPLHLRPGANTLTFRTREAAVVADTVTHTGDPRPLSIAISDWKWDESPTLSAH